MPHVIKLVCDLPDDRVMRRTFGKRYGEANEASALAATTPPSIIS